MKKLFFAGVLVLVAALTSACGQNAPPPEVAQATQPPPRPTETPIPAPSDTPRPAPTPTDAPPPTASPTLSPTTPPTEPPPVAATGPSAEQQALLDALPVNGAAPPVRNEVWLNSDPLAWESLAGKVVIVDFWTYG